eukprot:14644197-Alexandrium_andersonii.AAC.1
MAEAILGGGKFVANISKEPNCHHPSVDFIKAVKQRYGPVILGEGGLPLLEYSNNLGLGPLLWLDIVSRKVIEAG